MKVEAMNQTGAGPESLQNVLARLGAECAELGQLAEQLQAVLGPALLRIVDDADCHRNVQSLDLMAQRLAGVAAFLTALRAQVPPAWSADADAAARGVTLSELARRLRGEPGADHGHDDHEAGALEMF
jgi:hypothetical protein